MSQTITENAAETFTETAQKASRVTDAITNAIEDGIGMARHIAKGGCDAAEDLLNDTAGRLRRHLALTVAITFTFGVAMGALIGWTFKPR